MRPTWGFRLHGGAGPERPPYRKIGRLFWQLPLTMAMFFSMMDAWDQWHLAQASATRTVSIPMHAIHTTDFGLTREQANDLYRWGSEAAKSFFASPAIKTYANSLGQPLEPDAR